MLSKYCKEIAGRCKIKVGDVKKSVPNLGNKTKYVLHYKNRQLYLSLGMKLTKVHRVLKFKQSDWKSILILILKKEKMQLMILTKILLKRLSVLFMGKKWKIYQKESM